ncbi:MAG: M20 family metallo-hydrolase [Chitinophagaceae bacterium]
MSKSMTILQEEAIELLKKLIALPSFSKEEQQTADLLERYLEGKGVRVKTHLNNIWAQNKFFTEGKPVLLLNSHHDTVKPNKSYTLDPFLPLVKDEKLFGLGSNDAWASLVALLAVFLHYYDQPDLRYNLLYAATAEEEISGPNGVECLLPRLGNIACGIVGEPTQMQMAVAEKGLLVIDALATGKAGHAAREEGENAIYLALRDIAWFQDYQFPKVSPLLGPVKMTITVIETENKAHNVVPAQCRFVVDCRVNELYSFEEILETLERQVKSRLTPRSTRLRSTAIDLKHPLVEAGLNLGRTYYGSPTTSDKALMPFPTLKLGPGDSARSHTADEYIYLQEIREGIELYIRLLDQLLLP